MRFKIVLRYIGVVLLCNAALMLLSALVSLLNGVDSSFYPLVISAAVVTVLGAFPFAFVRRAHSLSNKEGYGVVVGAWLASCVVGMMPYMLYGGEFDLSGAWFESVSGFTTTGASVLSDVEILPKGLLFWRSCTHLLGGIGIIMFVLIAVPSLGKAKMMLSNVELSALAKDNYRYKTNKVAKILLSLYLGLVVVAMVLLKFAGMNWFDAVNHAFSAVATGGFSTKNLSIGFYDSRSIELIVMVFMVLSGVHFGVTFATLAGRRQNIFRSEVSRYYIGSFLVGAVLIAISLFSSGVYPTASEAARVALFQSISVVTTTGFTITETQSWPPMAILVLLFLGMQCACAGSTSGGIKADRVWLTLKLIRARVLKQQHPNAVVPIKLNGVVQDEVVVRNAMLFIVVYILLIFVGSLILTATGLDINSSFTTISACMGNMGVGYGEVGALGMYAGTTPFVKGLCTLFMLLGRLEIFGFIQLFIFNRW